MLYPCTFSNALPPTRAHPPIHTKKVDYDARPGDLLRLVADGSDARGGYRMAVLGVLRSLAAEEEDDEDEEVMEEDEEDEYEEEEEEGGSEASALKAAGE